MGWLGNFLLDSFEKINKTGTQRDGQLKLLQCLPLGGDHRQAAGQVFIHFDWINVFHQSRVLLDIEGDQANIRMD